MSPLPRSHINVHGLCNDLHCMVADPQFDRCRDQNFGINELAAVQDVRNEFNLQDIADDPAVDRGNYRTIDRTERIM